MGPNYELCPVGDFCVQCSSARLSLRLAVLVSSVGIDAYGLDRDDVERRLRVLLEGLGPGHQSTDDFGVGCSREQKSFHLVIPAHGGGIDACDLVREDIDLKQGVRMADPSTGHPVMSDFGVNRSRVRATFHLAGTACDGWYENLVYVRRNNVDQESVVVSY